MERNLTCDRYKSRSQCRNKQVAVVQAHASTHFPFYLKLEISQFVTPIEEALSYDIFIFTITSKATPFVCEKG